MREMRTDKAGRPAHAEGLFTTDGGSTRLAGGVDAHRGCTCAMSADIQWDERPVEELGGDLLIMH